MYYLNFNRPWKQKNTKEIIEIIIMVIIIVLLSCINLFSLKIGHSGYPFVHIQANGMECECINEGMDGEWEGRYGIDGDRYVMVWVGEVYV